MPAPPASYSSSKKMDVAEDLLPGGLPLDMAKSSTQQKAAFHLISFLDSILGDRSSHPAKTGHVETKQLREMLPSILNQLGADSLTSLRRRAEALPKQSVDGEAPLATGEDDDDDEVPDLVENFDEASKNEAN
ncbi:transcription factor BTF3-like [Microtus oregoni]|uniref:transcription factor BTF3-like n=1 Tax=Microtus oregoni TaxID=111838 RepID=UPI001BB19BFB|nr:transcription factor BTF3-like [Microtus oregoni]